MRILGAILLIAGFFLCLTILWAAIGFLAMGLGLICLLIAERRQEQLKKRALPQMPGLQREAAQAIPEQEVASNTVPPELPKTEQHPPYPGGPASAILSRRSSVEEEDGHAARRMVAARSYAVEGRRLIAKDDGEIPQPVNVTKPFRAEYATPLAATAPPAATSPPNFPGIVLVTASGGWQAVAKATFSNRPPASPAPKAAATPAAASREVRTDGQEAQAAGQRANHSADTSSRRAGVFAGEN